MREIVRFHGFPQWSDCWFLLSGGVWIDIANEHIDLTTRKVLLLYMRCSFSFRCATVRGHFSLSDVRVPETFFLSLPWYVYKPTRIKTSYSRRHCIHHCAMRLKIRGSSRRCFILKQMAKQHVRIAKWSRTSGSMRLSCRTIGCHCVDVSK